MQTIINNTKVINRSYLYDRKQWLELKNRALKAGFCYSSSQIFYSVYKKSGYRVSFKETYSGYNKNGQYFVVNVEYITWHWGCDADDYNRQVPTYDGEAKTMYN